MKFFIFIFIYVNFIVLWGEPYDGHYNYIVLEGGPRLPQNPAPRSLVGAFATGHTPRKSDVSNTILPTPAVT